MSTETTAVTAGGVQLVDTPGRPARPAGYWERVARIVDAGPPLANDQRARIRAAFHQPEARRAAA
ncbi:hypothetical protein [Streptomyces canus]|uniref:hypothetical protein n=1 Tax=Streptomyces canus TaxID=58343 RepID=UPI000749CE7E|nr:hypothetical protein [Streptomyces canus]KUN12711.1 hypothetical protein AQI96_13035 [Streptomyces canus]